MSQFLQAALAMARAGFRVFPLIPGDKKPAVSRFPLVATNDEAQVRAWWTERPDCNIGISTSGFVVLDVDTKKGQIALDNFHMLGGDLRNTFVVRTATGGYHAYYTGPNSKLAVDLVFGVDVRSAGGYVVGPGSVTSSRNPGCVDGSYEVITSRPMASVPPAFHIMLQPPGELRQRDDNAERDTPQNIQNAKSWLLTAEPAIEGQGGNNQTFRVAARLVRDFALTPETAYQLLVAHYNERCIPPWQNAELWGIVENAEAYGTSNLGAATPERLLGEGVTMIEPPPVEAAQPYVYQPKGVHLGNAVPPDKQIARPWRVEKLLMTGELSILGGIGSAGKSMFELTAAAHFALGKDFGVFKLRVPGVPLRSIIYNGEDDIMEASRRLWAICAAYNFDYYVVTQNIALMDDRQGELTVAAQQHGVPITNQQATDYIINTARETRADVLIFDPLVNLHNLNESDNGHMRFFVGVLRNIGRAADAAVLVAHHTAKGASLKAKDDADGFRGASSIVNSSRAALLLSGMSKTDREQYGIREGNQRDYFRIDSGKANYSRKENDAIEWFKWQTVKHVAGDLIGVPMLANLKARQSDHDKELATIIRDYMRMHAVGSCTRTDAAHAIKASGHVSGKLSDSSLRNMMATMLERPVLIGDDRLELVSENGKELIRLT